VFVYHQFVLLTWGAMSPGCDGRLSILVASPSG